jgi:hypothetical protein
MGITHHKGLNIGSGSDVTKITKAVVSIDPPSIAAGAVADVAVTVTGAVVGDSVVVNPPTAGLTAGLLVCQARVSAANTVTVRLHNASAGVIDEAAANWAVLVVSSA